MILTIWIPRGRAASQAASQNAQYLHLPLFGTSGRKTEGLQDETKMLDPGETSGCQGISCCQTERSDKHNAGFGSKNCESVVVEKEESRWGLDVMFGEDQHAGSDGRGQAQMLGPCRRLPSKVPAVKEKERGR